MKESLLLKGPNIVGRWMVSAFLVVMEMKDHWGKLLPETIRTPADLPPPHPAFLSFSFVPASHVLHQTSKPALMGVWLGLIGCVNDLFWIISG